MIYKEKEQERYAERNHGTLPQNLQYKAKLGKGMDYSSKMLLIKQMLSEGRK